MRSPAPAAAEEAGRGPESSLAGRAYRRIKEKILLGEIPPLGTVDDRALMAELGTGRTPIREALQRLAFEGLVVVLPYRGTMASGIDMSELDQIMEVRIPLEILAARAAAQRATAPEIAALEALVGGYDIERLCAERRFVELLRLDQEFHHAVAAISRNRFMVRTLENLRDLTWRFYILFYRRHPPTPRDSFNNYREVIAALARHDPDLVEKRLAAHFRDTRRLFPA
ncbi:MAG: GntR family transcriptional regulator [Dongiaceae bacterium]